MSEQLNILQLCRKGSRVLGPGLRYVIWVQGCPFRCPNCETPEGQPLTPNMLIEIDELVRDIVGRRSIEGITLSGGEPFEQAEALASLLEKVQSERPELNVISYTGYQKEQLIAPSQKALLDKLDVLIDGKYIHELNDDVGLRGSSNQRVHFLTDRLIAHKEMFEHGKRNLEIIVHGADSTIIGLTKKDRINILQQ